MPDNSPQFTNPDIRDSSEIPLGDSMASRPLLPLESWTFRRVVWVTLVLVFVGISFWVLYRFNQVVFVLFIAILLGTVIRPGVNWLHQRGLPRMVGIILIFFLFVALFIGFMLLLFPIILKEGTAIAVVVPGYYQSLQRVDG